MFDGSHYATACIFLKTKLVVVYDGLHNFKTHQQKYDPLIIRALIMVGLLPKSSDTKDRHREHLRVMPREALWNQKDDVWRLEYDPSFHQFDGTSCGPLACAKATELLTDIPFPKMLDDDSFATFDRYRVLYVFSLPSHWFFLDRVL